MTEMESDAHSAATVVVDPPALPPALGSLLINTPTAIVGVDHAGRIRFVNESASLLFQHREIPLAGKAIEVLLPCLAGAGNAAQRYSYLNWPVARRVEPDLHPLGLRSDGHTFAVDVSLTPTDLGDGRHWAVVSVIDVSARVEAERKVTWLNRAYLTLAQINHAVIHADDASALFEATCRIAVEQGGYLAAWVATPRADGTVEAAAVAGDLDAYIAQVGITVDPLDPGSRGPVGTSLREGRSRISTDFLDDPATAPWHDAARKCGIVSCGSFPLRTAGRVVGALTLYSDHPSAFDNGVAALLTQVTDNVSYALDGFEGGRALEAKESARAGLLLRLVTAEEKERGRIAGDLHDDSVQVLAAVNLRLGLLQRRLGTSPELADVARMVQHITATVGVASESLRQLLFELEPPLLARSFDDALRTTADHVFEDEATTWAVHCPEEIAVPDVERGQALRIVKESLINARKHACASHVAIDVHAVAGGIEVAVIDDGDGLPEGMDLEHPPSRRGHRGFETMRDRATATGGWCRLERGAVSGTTLRFFVPTVA